MEITANFTADFQEFVSDDGALDIIIPDGTDALDEDGLPLSEVEFNVIKKPPQDQEVNIIGRVYELEPDGATFDPPITLIWRYDPADIPEEFTAEEMIIVYYDSESSGWIGLDSNVTPEKTVITAPIEHLSTFALAVPSASPSSPPPTLETTAATFTVSSMSISPVEVSTGESVDISVLLTNTSEVEGNYILALKIDGVTEETKTISLPGGESKTVTFTTSKEETGDYDVDVSGLPGFFSVSQASPDASPTPTPTTQKSSSPGVNWTIVVPVLVAVFLAIFIPLWLRKKRESFDW